MTVNGQDKPSPSRRMFVVGAIVSLITGFLMTLFACPAHPQDAKENGTEATTDFGERNVLIVYLSRTGNTRAVAKMIHESVGGELVGLELVTPYPRDYETIVDQVDRENEADFLPPLKTRVKEIEKYDIVFLGFPTWDMQLPPPMKSFLNEHDLSGKQVIPFNTNAKYGVGSGFRDVEERCSTCKVRQGLSVRGGFEKKGVLLAIKGDRAVEVRGEVNAWLRRLGLL